MVLYCVAQSSIRLKEPARPIRVVGTQGSTHMSLSWTPPEPNNTQDRFSLYVCPVLVLSATWQQKGKLQVSRQQFCLQAVIIRTDKQAAHAAQIKEIRTAYTISMEKSQRRDIRKTEAFMEKYYLCLVVLSLFI
jgi:hypothetical protein